MISRKTTKFKELKYIFAGLILASILFSGCSTQKNTWASRNYHMLTSRYNVDFNAEKNLQEGINAINNANNEDYSTLIPLFVISHHENASAGKAKMDIVIEKCRKIIKLHSITRKPKRNANKWKNPNYKAFYYQSEFIPEVKQAWIKLGQAQFYQADFIGALATFMYVIHHYSDDRAIIAEAQIWEARCYGEMDWIYQAEQAFSEVKAVEIPKRLEALYAETQAFLFIKAEKDDQALPFLKLASEKERDKTQSRRINYLIGQISMLENKKAEASVYFKKVLRSNPPYLMQFNAALQAFQAEASNPQKAVAGLKKMARNNNNSSYLDQIYNAIGNVYLAKGDTVKALGAYDTGVEKSIRNGADKARILITEGDIYFKQKKFIHAEPCYTQAAQIMSASNPEYPRVQNMSQTLGKLAEYYNTVILQDSLQHLSTLSKAEQLATIKKVIEQVKKDEAATIAKTKQDSINASKTRNNRQMTMIGATDNSWYFYNNQLKNAGSRQFIQKWGQRKLEDNWQRSNKILAITGNNPANANVTTKITVTTNQGTTAELNEADNKAIEYYLKQIPKTQADITASNMAVGAALFGLGTTYYDNLHDNKDALNAFFDLQNRFPKDSNILNSYYYCYLIYGDMKDHANQQLYKNKITKWFPDSRYATMLSHPEYAQKYVERLQMQDSIYRKAYKAYTKNEFGSVESYYTFMTKNYPLSDLMPKFAFLNALSKAKTSSKAETAQALSDVISKYPNSDVTSTAKGILALIDQGEQAQRNTSSTSDLASKRRQAAQQMLAASDNSENAPSSFSEDIQSPYYFILIPKKENTKELNKLLYDLAAFNFSRFMIKNFDLQKGIVNGTNAILVSGFSGLKETLWYENMLLSDRQFQGRVTFDVCNRLIISDNNLKLIGTKFTLDDYNKFYSTTLMQKLKESVQNKKEQ